MTHELKIQKQWADAKLAGEKPFEVRINDRGFQKGDVVRYRVVDPKTSLEWRDESGSPHPIEQCDFLITYVLEGADGLEKGYCVYADCPVPRKAPEGPARVQGEAYSGDFMRITKDGLNAMEKALEECGRTPSAGYEFPATSSASSPVSADLGPGTTPSNGTADPLAPPPLAEPSDGEVHTDVKSVSKSSEGCKDFVGKFNGICRFAYATTPSGALSWPSGALSCGCKTSANYGKRCPIERSI